MLAFFLAGRKGVFPDLFTKTVEVSLYNGTDYEPLVQPKLEVKRNKIKTLVENS